MAKTRKPIVRGLVTTERLAELQPGVILRIHVFKDKHWRFLEVRFIERRGGFLYATDSLDDVRGCPYDLSTIGIIPDQFGKMENSFTTVRDEELGLRTFQ
jgi:hypothetical protein